VFGGLKVLQFDAAELEVALLQFEVKILVFLVPHCQLLLMDELLQASVRAEREESLHRSNIEPKPARLKHCTLPRVM
jgi:hypothetical protein